jgi:hypothetical protein
MNIHSRVNLHNTAHAPGYLMLTPNVLGGKTYRLTLIIKPFFLCVTFIHFNFKIWQCLGRLKNPHIMHYVLKTPRKAKTPQIMHYVLKHPHIMHYVLKTPRKTKTPHIMHYVLKHHPQLTNRTSSVSVCSTSTLVNAQLIQQR